MISIRDRRRTGVAVVAALMLTFLTLLHMPSAYAAQPKALINSDTVTGGASSAEANLATSLGFSVDVVDGPTWDAMTQPQFASYQVLIAGDPTCSTIASSFITNEATWAPVVMGTAVNTKEGNRVLVGTDPVLHSGGTGPRTTVISDGIDFAGAQPGRTGLYFDTSCGGNYYSQAGVAASMMGQLSSGSGTWTEDDTPPCGGNVAKIASTPKFDSLSTADLEGWGCSVHESFPTFASDWSALAVATDTTSHPTCGTDNTVTPPVTACGEAYVLIAGSGIVVVSPNITLTPATSTNPAGTSHTVTANVTQSGSPVVGQLVTFTVTGQNNGASGTCVPADCKTDSSGNVTFTYLDANGPGDDTILASFTDTSGTTQQASAAKHWAAAADSPITPSGLTFSPTEGNAYSGQVASFTDPDPASTAGEYSATIDWGDGSPTSTGNVSGPTGGPFTVNGSHTYADEGTNKVSVTINDTDNTANTATASSTANVGDAALSAAGVTPTSPQGFNGVVANFTDANIATSSPADFTATIDWGDGSSTSTGTVSGSGGSYTVNGTHTYAGTGYFPVKVHIVDDGGSSADASSKVLIFGTASGGNFVIGDKNAAVGTSVTFWGAQWSKHNTLSGGSAPASFKGFADSPAAPGCAVSWTTDPGNSTPPPAGPLPAYMAVIVSSSITNSGPSIGGNNVHIVVVRTDSGYAPNPGNAGTGTVVGVVC